VIQGGYFITDNIEAFARYEWYDTVNQGSNNPAVAAQSPFLAQQNSIVTFGANWYLNKSVKFTLDAGWANNGIGFNGGIYNSSVAGTNYQTSPTTTSGSQWVFRGQMQLLF
jgi:hypothetical protein